MDKFIFIDWPKTVAKFGYSSKQLTGRDRVIVLCMGCQSEMEYKFSSIRSNHGKSFNPVCHSCGQQKVWLTPTYAQSQSETQRKLATQRWASDEYRAAVVTSLKAAHRNSPDYTNLAVAALRGAENLRKTRLDAKRNDPKYRAKISAASKANWANEDYRRKMITALSSPEIRTKISDGVKAAWTRPEYARAVLINQKSKLEDNLSAVLDDLGIVHDRQYCLGHWPFDFHIPHHPRNLLIEVHGEYWHGARFEHHRSRDQAKATFVERYHSETHELKILWEHEFLSPDRIQYLVASWFGKAPEHVEYDLSHLTLGLISASEANLFLSKYHHTASGGRNGTNIAARLGETVIAVAKYCYPTRMESASKQNMKYKEVMELTRLARHQCYHNKNLLSWFIARTQTFLPSGVKRLITFADSTYGHTGAIYKASNWQEDGIIPPDYFYKDPDGFIMHKKTLWNQAKKMGMSEVDYAATRGYVKCVGGAKTRFIFKMRN